MTIATEMCFLLSSFLVSSQFINGEMENETNQAEKPVNAIKENHDSGINAFFRVMSNNLNQQNILADNKANIMISINTVVLSLVIGSSARNIEYWQNMIVPMLCLVGTSLLTTVFAVLATRPRFISGVITQSDISQKKSSLLFFGNFTSLSLPEFEDAMITVLKDDEYLYRCILAEFHGQGLVLKRKYNLLRYSYSTFLIGMIISIAGFVVAQVFVA